MYNIVIVEDELIEMESIERIVSQCIDNAIIHKATTGKKAIKLIDDVKNIDMLLVDINIPLPNGKEVIKYLRAKNRDAKVIVTTANDDFDMLRDMYHLQIQDYLLKPVKQRILSETIKNALEFDEEISKASKEKKQELIKFVENHDYALWNDFVLEKVNESYLMSQQGNDARDSVKSLLDTLCLYLDSLDESYSQYCSKLYSLSEEIDRLGLKPELYPQLVFSLLDISSALFSNSFRKQLSNIGFIARSKFYIEKNLLKNVTLDEVAEKTFVSSCYLSRAFKKSESVGFSNYLTKRKVILACGLLKFSHLKINTIALELAWKDSNYFCRIFKKEVGISPSDYREKHEESIH